MNRLPPLHPSDATFPYIRRVSGFYVDKTPLLRKLLDTSEDSWGGTPLLNRRHQFLARPRRFGKSLLISTLETWFQGLPPETHHPTGEPDGHMEMPAGWTSPAWLWAGLDAEDWHGHHGWHPVIRLDMSRAVSPDPSGSRLMLQEYLNEVVELWRQRVLPDEPPWPSPPKPDASPTATLRKLIGGLSGLHRKKRPVVLVDEYDAPITEHVGTDRDPKPAVDELRMFYRGLKDDEGRLYGVFITGITRFGKQHLFSTLNNVADISEMPAYGDLCGFTEDEVDYHFAPYRDKLVDMEPRLRDRDIQADWRTLYNGYRFSPLPEAPRVYNPFTLTSGLDRVLQEAGLRRLAADGQWPSAWSESGHPKLTAQLARDTGRELPEAVAAGGKPPTPTNNLSELTHPDYVRLMLETGYYTWHGGADGTHAHLNFPNREVAESWLCDILNMGAPEQVRHTLHPLLHDLRTCLEQEDVPGFAKRLETFAFGLARENLQSEASFRTLLQSLLELGGLDARAEKSTAGGRSDLETRVGNKIYVIEAKFNRPVTAAHNQIRDRQYGREHLGRGLEVIAVGLAFRHDLNTGPRIEYSEDNLADLLAEERNGDTLRMQTKMESENDAKASETVP